LRSQSRTVEIAAMQREIASAEDDVVDAEGLADRYAIVLDRFLPSWWRIMRQ
jgi:hypothetical protein